MAVHASALIISVPLTAFLACLRSDRVASIRDTIDNLAPKIVGRFVVGALGKEDKSREGQSPIETCCRAQAKLLILDARVD